jgi:hypothetical protein
MLLICCVNRIKSHHSGSGSFLKANLPLNPGKSTDFLGMRPREMKTIHCFLLVKKYSVGWRKNSNNVIHRDSVHAS